MAGPDFPKDEWLEIDLEEGWSLWDGPVDERLVTAAGEIKAHKAKIVRTYICTACKGKAHKPLARVFSTSVGQVWRVEDRTDFRVDEIGKPGAPILCPVHGDKSIGTR